MSAKARSANPKSIHATCVALGLEGVLLLGESGSGKSDLALRLIDGGARLVADDRTELFLQRGLLCARAPRAIAGLMEVRGLGIVAMPFRKDVAVRLAVRLSGPFERLPDPRFFIPPGELEMTRPVPLLFLDARAASAPARIRLALKALGKGLIRNEINPSSRARK
jgi:HPr kinase/phosphorylase